MSQRIFVYRPGAIGDTVLTLPALAALRRRYPGCTITYAGNAAMLALLPVEVGLSADDVRLLPLFEEPPKPWPDADVHVVFARQPCGLPGLQRDPLEALQRGRHMADWLLEAIEPAAGEALPRLEVEPGQGAELVIHPGAGAVAKRWPADRFAELVRRLGRGTAVVQGLADPPFELPEAEVWHNLSLAELARRIKGSSLFIGNDSGITHLASAVGTPTVAMYLVTDPLHWGIRGAQARSLHGDIPVESVLAATLDLSRSA